MSFNMISDVLKLSVDAIKKVTGDDIGGEIGDKIISGTRKASIVNSRGKSLRTMTKQLILDFPCLISESISIENMEIIAKSFEMEYAYLVKLLFSNTQNAAQGLVNSIHTNITRAYAESENIKKNLISSQVYLEDKVNLNSLNNSTLPKFINLNEDTKIDRSSVEINKNAENFAKKVNTALPTMLSMGVTTENEVELDNGRTEKVIRKVDINIGIKVNLHILRSKDIVYHFNNKLKDTSKIFNFIRWFTGEKKLFRDLILCIDINKRHAIDAISSNNYWWKKLSDMAKTNKTRRIFRAADSPLSGEEAKRVATMIISKDDADMILKQHGIDIVSHPEFAAKIVRNLYLLSFGIADESAELLYLFNEDTGTYQAYSFKGLKGKTKDKIDVDDLVSIFKR